MWGMALSPGMSQGRGTKIKTTCFGHKNIWVQVLAVLLPGLLLGQVPSSSETQFLIL